MEQCEKKIINCDFIIFGGGIAGLWLLNWLKKAGFSVILFEKNKLGSGQTLKSQGIIHSGLKYSLQGKVTTAHAQIQELPKIWDQCFSGSGEIDLSACKVLAPHYYFWLPHHWGWGKFFGKIVQKLLADRSELVKFNEQPLCLQQQGKSASVYRVAEKVIDVYSLLTSLIQPYQDLCLKLTNDVKIIYNDQQDAIKEIAYHLPNSEKIIFRAQYYLGTVGENLFNTFVPASKYTQMQIRPLHMVAAKMPVAHELYAHCVGRSAVPRLTITTHACRDGKYVWYLGGAIAENGVELNSTQQITQARKEIAKLFPKLNLQTWQWRSFLINRAENATPNGERPQLAHLDRHNNMLWAWPTKLTLVPALAEQLRQFLQQENYQPQLALLDLESEKIWQSLPRAELAPAFWEEIF